MQMSMNALLEMDRVISNVITQMDHSNAIAIEAIEFLTMDECVQVSLYLMSTPVLYLANSFMGYV